MCAIIDANVMSEVFGDNRTPRGRIVYEWLTRGRTGRLIVGGKLLRELSGSSRFKAWLAEAIPAGRARRINGSIVEEETKSIRAGGLCRSNDQHVIALARVSGARLLFTDDRDLEQDFKNRLLIPGERSRGKIYKSSRASSLLYTIVPPYPTAIRKQKAGCGC